MPSWLRLVQGLSRPTAQQAVAQSQLTRWLTPEKCRQYLHTDTCPAKP